MFMQNFIKLGAAVHELSCWQTFCSTLQWWKILSCDLDLWPWNSIGFEQLSRYMFYCNRR